MLRSLSVSSSVCVRFFNHFARICRLRLYSVDIVPGREQARLLPGGVCDITDSFPARDARQRTLHMWNSTRDRTGPGTFKAKTLNGTLDVDKVPSQEATYT